MICSRCTEERGDNFSPGKKVCRVCASKRRRELYAADPEKFKAISQRNRKNRRESVNKTNREYRSRNREKAYSWTRKSTLKAMGWEPGRWERTLELQAGICATPGCGRLAEVADHCHETGRARGALCHGCNMALGLIADSPERARGLALYLEMHQLEMVEMEAG